MSDEALRLGHEYTDVPVRAALLAAAAILCTITIVVLAVSRCIAWFGDHRFALSGPLQPVIAAATPEPRLEVDPTPNARAVRDQAEALLASAGWVDRDRGIARIPIDVAMRLMAERGWPPERP